MSAVDSPSAYPLEQLYSEHHGWLFGWLRCKLRCSHRAADLAELALTVEALEGHQSPESIHITLEALEQIAFLLEGLHPNARQAFVDYYLDELSQPQIAERLGVSPRMVRKYLTQALVHCHQALDLGED